MMLRSMIAARGVTRSVRLTRSLAVRFASAAATTANPLVECVRERTLPPFERLEISHIEPAVKDAAADYTRDLRELERSLASQLPDIKWDQVVNPLELQSDPLGRMWGVVGHLMSVRNSDELRKVHDELQQLVIQTFTETSQSKTLFDAYQAVRNGSEWEDLTLAQQ
ncbi:hypothetical protein P43SY_011443 [Pythium insidiosum]|uniref:Oligopeptidase A N-terminal domain-containing protein n=1 Tax=Pythium insidiosum TaxID=114742 RepID=A0AAD5Q0Y5_PYTIN|nr:hypothetical protein P43SY_011443 [Pythium insidiosum]